VLKDPLLGRTVGQYEILSRLGGGAMGVVYKAHDRKLQRLVALKFLPQEWSHDQDAKQRFLGEAQAASATHHPNICSIHDIATADDGQLFIVMAYCDGPTLKQRLQEGPLPLDEALDIATQVADGLTRAHAQGVVHRDIKPGNLILTEDGVRIVDFGLATFVDALQSTAQGSTLGTAAYMSPEQVRGEEADARTDVWALGVVLYEMLTGHVPFRGAYAEAIAYAIRTDPPTPIRNDRPDVPEEIEQFVFRALHKDPAVRFADGREVARALRQARGFTLPQDLRTRAVVVPPANLAVARAPARRRRRALWAAAALALIAALSLAWVLAPPTRRAVVVAPVSNRTGDAGLTAYRLAMTQVLIANLEDSRDLRIVPYDRLLQIVRRFLGRDGNPSGLDALQAIGANAGAEVIVVPAIVNENGLWHARAELHDPRTGPTSAEDVITESTRSALGKDTAFQLMGSLASRIQERFTSRRSRSAEWLLSLFGDEARTAPLVANLEAAKALEEGARAYEALEYHSARSAFAAAAMLDPASPLPPAWAARVATLMRQETEAVDASLRATRLVSDRTRSRDRLFVNAVAAEAERDFDAAEDRYRELAGRYSDEARGLLELAGYQDRRGLNKEAIETYHRALDLDATLVRPRVDLCRVYNRLNESVTAREHGRLALAAFRNIADTAGEVQALFCLTEAFRNGDEAERREAAGYAAEALRLVQSQGYAYNLARAHQYRALVAVAQGNQADAIAFWSEAAAAARTVGNAGLQAVVLMNIGVAHESLGHAAQALASLKESYALYEKSGDQARAAEAQANIGFVLIEYGIDPDVGLQNLENALGIFRQRGNTNFEVFGAEIKAANYRYIGQPARAIEELNRARAVALDRKFGDEVAITQIGLAQALFDQGDYGQARDLLVESLAGASARENSHARLRLAQTYIRMGDYASAAREIDTVRREVRERRDDGLFPLLHATAGELAYQSGAMADARRHFSDAAAFWTDDLPDEPSVEARGYLGFLDGMEGQVPRGRQQVQACIDRARQMRRLLLETRCSVFLARLELDRDDPAAALQILNAVPDDSDARQIGPELRVQVRHWRGEALARRGDVQGGAVERAAARTLAEHVRDRLPERYRNQFANRVDIRPVLGPVVGSP
jgi:tetratricopeptide (TPR) repeat protein